MNIDLNDYTHLDEALLQLEDEALWRGLHTPEKPKRDRHVYVPRIINRDEWRD
ncbi:MAG: hypothetical protein Q7O66_16835 [Dehalococcoidia bacterium]|nr:hypothetical protein [Dehalococcoidia bacterium]